MRTVLATILAVCVASGLARAGQATAAGQEATGTPPAPQQTHPPRGRVERELQSLSASLGLTDDQVEKIRPILETRNQQLKDLRANSAMPQGEARAKAAAIRRSARRQIDRILTPQQKQKQKEMRRGRNSKSQAGN